ncbi:23876_t:CDS:2 [Cetraspora pellucida]|uniref:23876_t:CDS:1 n=1 Tax=Cetraspora pellucida TaxID=1433469 RepID=A0A9N9EKF4_9GLOM|nr:23876_t:CDS:2 [Cetraspora pellucida]
MDNRKQYKIDGRKWIRGKAKGRKHLWIDLFPKYLTGRQRSVKDDDHDGGRHFTLLNSRGSTFVRSLSQTFTSAA